MKELSIEEKAKRYDEALHKAKNYYSTTDSSSDIKLIGLIFPELKESEDERIRKELIAEVKEQIDCIPAPDCRDKEDEKALKQLNKWLAWLEKQGEHANFRNKIQIGDKVTRNEDGVLVNLSQLNRVAKKDEKQGDQKPTNKVEPKFKVDDWVVCEAPPKHSAFVTGDVVQISNKETLIMFLMFENCFRKWTIQDAKDGDVLADGNLPFIFKKIDANKYSYAYCGISVDDGFKIESDVGSGEWTWMQDIKPATKEQRDLLFQKMKEAGYEWDAEKKELRKIEQKSAWSEKYIADVFEKVGLAKIVREQSNDSLTNALQDAMIELSKFLPQQKQEWSEEDEKMYNVVHDLAWEAYKTSRRLDIPTFGIINDWLKSLKPQNRWKPSERQKEALLWCVVHLGGADKQTLGELLEELNKL